MNLVEDYLAENKNRKLSFNTLYRRLDISRRSVRYYIRTSEHIKRVDPLEVGSGKTTISVYTYF